MFTITLLAAAATHSRHPACHAANPFDSTNDSTTGGKRPINDRRPVVVTINVNAKSDFQHYADEYDLLDASDKTMTVTAIVNGADVKKLDEEGASYTIDQTTTAEFDAASKAVQDGKEAQAAAGGAEALAVAAAGTALPSFVGIPGYSCYRTVEETYVAAEHIANNYPDIAEWIDIGPSTKKEQDSSLGYNMYVLKLTNNSTTVIGADLKSTKPKFFATCSIHAREYAPAELCTRFAVMLAQGYGTGNDADITALLDHHEVHLVLQANPDGRKIAEGGVYWRKNDKDNCGSSVNNDGTDLNRNWPYGWGGAGASSSCTSETFRGQAPNSEMETQNILTYIHENLWGNQRDLPQADFDSGDVCLPGSTFCPSPMQYPAPLDATGVALDIHSYGKLMLWPWGYTSTGTGNDDEYVALGRKLAYFNGYTPQQSTSLYVTSGTTDDTWYGKYGAASFTYELGTEFFQKCEGRKSSFLNTILPDNLPSLLYAAKAAWRPYQSPSGPDVLLDGGNIVATAGESVTINAVIDDTRYNQANSRNEPTQPTQPIASAALYVDTTPWGGATPIQMAATDGSFDSSQENVRHTLDTTGMTTGRHTIYIVGQDSNGNEGVYSAVFLDIEGPLTGTCVNADANSGDVCLTDSACCGARRALRGLQQCSTTTCSKGSTCCIDYTCVNQGGGNKVCVATTPATDPPTNNPTTSPPTNTPTTSPSIPPTQSLVPSLLECGCVFPTSSPTGSPSSKPTNNPVDAVCLVKGAICTLGEETRCCANSCSYRGPNYKCN